MFSVRPCKLRGVVTGNLDEVGFGGEKQPKGGSAGGRSCMRGEHCVDLSVTCMHDACVLWGMR